MNRLTPPGKYPPRLLVSVRSAEEALAAIKGGAEIIDIKEPQRGSLGKADDATIAEIIQATRRRNKTGPLSIALGELNDWRPETPPPQLPAGVDFVKLGFSGCGSDPDWLMRWDAFRQRLAEQPQSEFHWVAVIYADWQAANAPPPRQILEAATILPCAGVLIDTFHKNGQSLLDILSRNELALLAREVHRRKLPFAVAGSLRKSDLPQLQTVAPQIVAIRSAACRDGERNGPICPRAVQTFREHLARCLSGDVSVE